MDDNLPLRSMRYEYYQMARKCMNILYKYTRHKYSNVFIIDIGPVGNYIHVQVQVQ